MSNQQHTLPTTIPEELAIIDANYDGFLPTFLVTMTEGGINADDYRSCFYGKLVWFLYEGQPTSVSRALQIKDSLYDGNRMGTPIECLLNKYNVCLSDTIASGNQGLIELDRHIREFMATQQKAGV